MMGAWSGGGWGAKFEPRASRAGRPAHHPAGRKPEWGASISVGGLPMSAPRDSWKGESVAVRLKSGQPNRRLELAARVH